MQPILVPLSLAIFFATVIWIFRLAMRANSPKNTRRALGLSFILTGFILIYFRIFNLAFLLLFLGSLLALGRIGRSAQQSRAQKSQVRSAHLEMTLDHDTGAMDGVILTGDYAGRLLSDFGLPELLQLRSIFSDDIETIKLLETYLDVAHSSWRDNAQDDAQQTGNNAPNTGGIGRDEAYHVLGLEPGASDDEIREAHRRLIKRVHPDRGGTAALAATINQARDRLLEGR